MSTLLSAHLAWLPLLLALCVAVGLWWQLRHERAHRRRAEAALAQERARHEAMQLTLREKNRFVAAVTHDLLQPHFALNLATQSLACHPLAAVLREPLGQLRSSVSATEALLSSLAMLVRLDSAQIQPVVAEASLQATLERLEAIYAPLAEARRLAWRVTPSLALVRTDVHLLERMLGNLIGNALRYTQHGGVLLSCRERRHGVLLQVWDTGPGVALEDIALLFRERVRDDVTRPGYGGMGLGLSIVRRCARLLRIKVTYRSVPGRGSCFCLLVPRADAAWPPTDAPPDDDAQ